MVLDHRRSPPTGKRIKDASTHDFMSDGLTEDPILDASMKKRLSAMAKDSASANATPQSSAPPKAPGFSTTAAPVDVCPSPSGSAVSTVSRWAVGTAVLALLGELTRRRVMATYFTPEPPPPPPPPIMTSVLLAAAVGIAIGVVGSLPIAGPGRACCALGYLNPNDLVAASVNVLKTGMEGKIGTARALAIGAGLGEGMWASIAFSGFYHLTSFIEQYAATFSVIGSVVLCGVGGTLLASKTKPPVESEDENDSSGSSSGLLLGLSLSALNPALLATYTGQALQFFGFHFQFTDRCTCRRVILTISAHRRITRVWSTFSSGIRCWSGLRCGWLV